MRYIIQKLDSFVRSNHKRFQRLGREFFWISLGQVIALFGALVGVRLLTGVLSPQIYGELALGMTLATLVNLVLFSPLSSAALRFFSPACEKGELPSFMMALRRMFVQVTGIVFLLLIGTGVFLLLTKQSKWLWLGAATLGFSLFSGYNSVLDGIQNAARQRLVVAWHQALAYWGRFMIAVGLVMWFGAISSLAMLGYMIGALLVLLSQFWFFKRKLLPTRNLSSSIKVLPWHWETKMFTYAWPFALWGIFTWAQLASDRWALKIFTGTREVGLYAVLYQLGYYPIAIFSGLITQLVAPVFFQRVGDASDPSRMWQVHILNWRLTVVTLFITGIATLLAFSLHRSIFRYLVAPEYREISWLLPGMVLAGGLFASGQCGSIIFQIGMETRSLLLPKVLTAIVGVLLNILGAAYWGVVGVVAASVIFYFSYTLWILILVRLRYKLLVSGDTTFLG
ncbi:MAG: lipopolysaccharide biosynthesis protein [Candidatus Omnitrophica bacterium]|nr:lipopolysaccharide biosynthesis protein [Candidatus Omnitrophota bacterium]